MFMPSACRSGGAGGLSEIAHFAAVARLGRPPVLDFTHHAGTFPSQSAIARARARRADFARRVPDDVGDGRAAGTLRLAGR